MCRMRQNLLLSVMLAGFAATALAQTPAPISASAPTSALSDIPAQFVAPAQADFTRREVMIPMRDGVKLFTVILIPHGAHRAPILLTRTPYDAARRTEGITSTHLATVMADNDVGDE